MAALISFLCPGRPGAQLVGDLRAAQSAIFVSFINGLVSPSYLQSCLCDGLCAREDNVELRCYQLVNFAVAMLGVVLLVVDMAFSATLFRLPPVLQWMVWVAKVMTGGTLQYGLSVFHFCLKMWCARLMLVFA